MTTLITNRDFYVFVAGELRARRGQSRSLEQYLLALRPLLAAEVGTGTLTLDALAGCLARAFDAPVPLYEPAWASEPRKYGSAESFGDVDRILRRQIVDLREMAESGALENEQRYYGINAPSGSRWYNFDPLTYMECGARGAFGGWEEEDDTGVEYVPGQVAAFGEDGKIVGVDPRSIVHQTAAIAELHWVDIASFLGCGQCYE